MGEYDNELKDIEFLYTVTPDEIDITKLNGLAPCRICVIQNTCTQYIRCKPYQEYKRKREKRK